MAELMNWPPSRGPNPHKHGPIWVEPDVVQEDVAFGPPQDNVPRPPIMSPDPPHETPEDADLAATSEPSGASGPVVAVAKPVLSGRWKVNYHVATVASLTVEQACRIMSAARVRSDWRTPVGRQNDTWFEFEPSTLTLTVEYPFGMGPKVAIQPIVRRWPACEACGTPDDDRLEMTPGWLLWRLAREYVRMYQEHEKYGVWGHAITDLYFETIQVEIGGAAHVGMGS